MSNFFRDSSVGFKSRTNIFTKFKSKETSSTNENSNSTGVSINEESESLPFKNDEADIPNTNTLMLISNNNSNLGLTNTLGDGNQTTQRTSDGSIVSGPGKKIFFSSTPINNNQISKKYPLNNVTSKRACVIRNQTKMKMMGENDDDDDFEITGVRELEEHKNISSLPKYKSKNTSNSKNQFISKTIVPKGSSQNIVSTKIEDVSNSSSSDVLLEAFTYTQKICSNLKQELILKQTENNKLKIKLNTYKNDINTVNINIENLKEKLTELEGKTRKLLSQKETDNTKIQNLKKEYEILKKRINGFRNDIVSLKTLLNMLHDKKKEIEFESTTRAKEIEYLKRELDDCSGQLSEEKIKNGSYTQELETFKNEIVRNFKHLTELSGNDLLQKNSIKHKELYDNLNVDFKGYLEKESKKILTRIENIDINLFERYVKMEKN